MEVGTMLKMTVPNFEVPEMKSSKELRKKVKIKHERIISIGGVTNGPKIAPKGQFNLTDFEVCSQPNLNSQEFKLTKKDKSTARMANLSFLPKRT